jgi:hypothetical protein
MANTKYPYRKELSQAEKAEKCRNDQLQLKKEARLREACEKEIETERKRILKKAKIHFKKLGYDTSNYCKKKKTEDKKEDIEISKEVRQQKAPISRPEIVNKKIIEIIEID